MVQDLPKANQDIRVQVLECGRCHKRKILPKTKVNPNLSFGDEYKTEKCCGVPRHVVIPRTVEVRMSLSGGL